MSITKSSRRRNSFFGAALRDPDDGISIYLVLSRNL